MATWAINRIPNKTNNNQAKRRKQNKISRVSPNQVYTFRRNLFYQDVLNSSATVDAFWSKSFKLSELPNASEFTNLFDQYKITKVEVTFYPMTMPVSSGLNNTGASILPLGATVPLLFTVVDYNSVNTTTLNQMRQYSTLNVTTYGRVHKRTFVPKMSTNVYQGVSGDGYAQPIQAPWVDTASAEVEYYGIKAMLNTCVSQNAQFRYNISVDVHIACRYTR